MRTIVIFFFLLQTLSASSQSHRKAEAPKAPRGYLSETHLKVAYALGLLKLIDTKPEVPENLAVFRNLIYKKVDTLSLMLDIYTKKNLPKSVPVLIFVHGGSWSKGKRSDYLPYLIDYALKGYVTVTVSYRLSRTAHFPAAVDDVKCAIRWVRAHAFQYHIDPDRIALIGGSAGGHLVLMAGYTDDKQFTGNCKDTVSARVQAIVDLYGPVDLTTIYARNRKESIGFIGKQYRKAPDRYKAASPRFYITPDDPPTLIFHGTIDHLVPVTQSDSLHDWLCRKGVPNEYYRLKGWPHAMDRAVKVNRFCQYHMDEFFNKYLQPME